MAVDYVMKRNVGTVGRPILACAICGWRPSGHILAARLESEGRPEYDKGLCNVHAQGLAQDEIIDEARLAQVRDAWLASRQLRPIP